MFCFVVCMGTHVCICMYVCMCTVQQFVQGVCVVLIPRVCLRVRFRLSIGLGGGGGGGGELGRRRVMHCDCAVLTVHGICTNARARA